MYGDYIKLPPDCLEVILNFDEKDQLANYEIVAWEEERHKQEVFNYEDIAEQAKLGNPDAQWKLYGTSNSILMNIEMLCAAAEQGHAKATRRVALFYRAGWGEMEKDLLQSYLWYIFSAKNGNQLSQNDAMKLWEDLTPDERKKAEKSMNNWKPKLCVQEFFRRSSEIYKHSQSFRESEKNFLAYLHSNNIKDKYIFLCRAADLGYVPARNSFAILYEFGRASAVGVIGLKKDLSKAYQWYKLCYKPGSHDLYPSAIDALDRIKREMTESQISLGEQFFSEWQPGQCEQQISLYLCDTQSCE